MSHQPVFRFTERFSPENLLKLLESQPNPQHFKRNVRTWLDRLKNPQPPSEGGNPGYVLQLRELAESEAREAFYAGLALSREETRLAALSPLEKSEEAQRVSQLTDEEIHLEVKARFEAVKREAPTPRGLDLENSLHANTLVVPSMIY